MKIFTTTVQLPDFLHKINLQTPILSLGSCFADHVASYFQDYKFQVWNNPFGILFNPVSIFQLLQLSIQNQTLDARKIIQNQEIWSHYDVHSQLSALSEEQLHDNIASAQKQMSDFWNLSMNHQKPSFLILTFGTAYVHRLKTTDEVVANCHKMPTHTFNKTLLSVSEILEDFHKIQSLLSTRNIRIILTVSPVRHIKETLSKNQVSKSVLRLACHEMEHQYENVIYFPAYEIMMDELRDYRFYADDLIHPSSMAIQYICEQFSKIVLDQMALYFMKKWKKIRQAINHRPQFENSQTHQIFLEKLANDIKKIKEVNTDQEFQQIEHKRKQMR